MSIFKNTSFYNHEQVVFCHDKFSNLKAIIAIHDTTLGPALGGTRMWNYATEEEALTDVLRLSRGMTYKSAVAGLSLGGGKAVIIGDAKKDKNELLFRTFGRFVNSLKGRYITAEDVGTSVKDMDYIGLETKYVTGTSLGSKDPSPFTALGTYHGIKAMAKEAYGSDSLHGKKIAVQGLGNVGYNTCKYIAKEGGQLIVTDINEEAIKRAVTEFGAEAVKIDEIYDAACDIYAPCALGATVNDDTIPRLKCDIIAGCANNVLKEERHGEVLKEKGILYAPDFVINAGGIISVGKEVFGYSQDQVEQKVINIYHNIETVLAIAKENGIPTNKAAIKMAEDRISKMRQSIKLTTLETAYAK